ncbi:DoxX family protein [Pseudonocardia sp. CA-107938]|uniref:DoxX family protein n=1 Tax=Pseudonocardia sp. CA-107938 TaxID=3240021 RepID=UPI003D8E1AB7
MSSRTPRSARALAVFLAAAGASHFAVPALYDRLVPEVLPGTPRLWTQLSGVAELAVAAAVALPRTRRVGGLAAAALFVAVLPANVKMAVDWSDRSPAERAIAYGRLPLQLPLVLWARRVSRAAAPAPGG